MIYPRNNRSQVLRFGIFAGKLGSESMYRLIQKSTTSKSIEKVRFKQTLSKNSFSTWIKTQCQAGAHPKVGRHSAWYQRKTEK